MRIKRILLFGLFLIIGLSSETFYGCQKDVDVLPLETESLSIDNSGPQLFHQMLHEFSITGELNNELQQVLARVNDLMGPGDSVVIASMNMDSILRDEEFKLTLSKEDSLVLENGTDADQDALAARIDNLPNEFVDNRFERIDSLFTKDPVLSNYLSKVVSTTIASGEYHMNYGGWIGHISVQEADNLSLDLSRVLGSFIQASSASELACKAKCWADYGLCHIAVFGAKLAANKLAKLALSTCVGAASGLLSIPFAGIALYAAAVVACWVIYKSIKKATKKLYKKGVKKCKKIRSDCIDACHPQ